MSRVAFPAIAILLWLLAVSCSDDSTDNEHPTTPLKIVSTYPPAGAEVSVLDSIVLTFSRNLDCSSVKGTTITVGPGRTGTITCDSNVVEFDPTYAFDFAVTITVTVSRDVTDVYGVGMENDFSYMFYTEVEPGGIAVTTSQ